MPITIAQGVPTLIFRRAAYEQSGMVRALLALPSIAVGDHDLLLRAVEIYEVNRLDFAEAYLVALAELSDVKRVASFDRQIDRVKSIQRVEP